MSGRLLLRLLVHTISDFKNKQPLLLGSSTAFFTIFSLPPIIIILVNILSLYFQRDLLSTQLFNEIELYFGHGVSGQIQNIVQNFRSQASSTWITIGGSVFLVFVSTTLFHVIRQALNYMWNIRVINSKKLKYNLKQRFISFLLIMVGGVLFFGSLLADTAVAVLHNYLDMLIPQVDSVVIQIISYVLSLVIVTFWFAILFRYLPDAKLQRKPALVGGLFTAVLFNLGKYLLGQFLITDNISNIFGTSASVLVLLLFIFYSSMIMYFGAAFTRLYAKYTRATIKPKKNAERYGLTRLDEPMSSF